jgi:hypothetical protein
MSGSVFEDWLEGKDKPDGPSSRLSQLADLPADHLARLCALADLPADRLNMLLSLASLQPDQVSNLLALSRSVGPDELTDLNQLILTKRWIKTGIVFASAASGIIVAVWEFLRNVDHPR